jgi:hypothetical protein
MLSLLLACSELIACTLESPRLRRADTKLSQNTTQVAVKIINKLQILNNGNFLRLLISPCGDCGCAGCSLSDNYKLMNALGNCFTSRAVLNGSVKPAHFIDDKRILGTSRL